MTIQCYNKVFTEEIQKKLSNMNYNKGVYCKKDANVSMQTYVSYEQIYQNEHRYNNGAVSEQLIGRVYIETILQETQTQEVYCLKYTNIPIKTQIIIAPNIINFLKYVVNPSCYKPLIIY